MTLERSHGKARPTLPRASELLRVASVRDPSDGRGGNGRFAAGNRLSVGAGWKNAVRKLLGPGAVDVDAQLVQRDAWRIYLATLRAMPSDAAPVRSLVALHARHIAVAGYFTAKAGTAGLDSERGMTLLDLASQHGQRAERLVVTALDVATRLARAEPAKAATLAEVLEEPAT